MAFDFGEIVGNANTSAIYVFENLSFSEIIIRCKFLRSKIGKRTTLIINRKLFIF